MSNTAGRRLKSTQVKPVLFHDPRPGAIASFLASHPGLTHSVNNSSGCSTGGLRQVPLHITDVISKEHGDINPESNCHKTPLVS